MPEISKDERDKIIRGILVMNTQTGVTLEDIRGKFNCILPTEKIEMDMTQIFMTFQMIMKI